MSTINKTDTLENKINAQSNNIISVTRRNATHIITGYKARLQRVKFRLHILKLALQTYGWKRSTFSMLKQLEQKRRIVHGEFPITKWVQSNDRIAFTLYNPGYPSQHCDDVLLEEMNRIAPSSVIARPIRFAHFAITKKCPLSCEHCFEWDNLNKKEILDYNDLRNIVLKLKQAGISQLHISGGEPMLRVNDIVKLCEEFCNSMEFWILTAGYNFTKENATRLKQAGVTGIIVSLDHYDKSMHNTFRQSKDAFDNAINAIKYARQADMVVAVTLCATKSFLTKENLYRYASFVHSLNVSYIQLLEPKAVGHYAGKDVTLNTEQIKILEDFYFEINNSPTYTHYPIVVYLGYYQRNAGCLAAGNRALYIDTNGDVLACTFCHISSGNALRDELLDVVNRMRKKGCSDYIASVL